MSFNVLTDPWVPLDEGGHVRLSSFLDVATGAADAVELLHPRDDFRFFARMLLSALAQAVFPAENARELRDRIDKPLARKAAAARITELSGDFELEGRFLQVKAPGDAENETNRLILDAPNGNNPLLFRHARTYRALCSSCAVIALYGAQAFAPQGGRGKSPGVRGAPPLTTLLWLPSVRKSLWANTLSGEAIRTLGYHADGAHPYRPHRADKAGERIGLVEGLFWQPRGIELRAAPRGGCDVCGMDGARMAAFGFDAKSKVSGGFFRHPHTPSIEDARPRAKRAWQPQYLRADRPAWTGLADMVSVVRGGTGDTTIAHAAPAVTQWFEGLGNADVTLVVLSYLTRQAKIVRRFSETYTLSMQTSPGDLVDNIRVLIGNAETALGLLTGALRAAKGGFFLDDARAELWNATEPPFRSVLAALQEGRDETRSFRTHLERVAMVIFDRHTEVSCLQNTRQGLIARARLRLRRELGRRLKGGHDGD